MEDNRIRRCLVSETTGLNTQITTNTTKKRRFKMHYSAYLSLWTKIGENNIFNFSVTKKMLIITKGWNTVSKDLTLVSCTFLFVFLCHSPSVWFHKETDLGSFSKDNDGRVASYTLEDALSFLNLPFTRDQVLDSTDRLF